MEKQKRTIEELNLIDDFLFTELMLDKEIAETLARMIIERATGEDVGQLIIEYQKVVNGLDTNLHGIRIDMAVTEERESEKTENPEYWDEITIRKNNSTKNKKKEVVRLFDIEPNNGKKEELPKRSRYSQSLMDVKLLESGGEYVNMPDVWSIWILPYDPFGQNQMIYTVKNVVENFEQIPYNDGIRKIFLNADGNAGGNAKLKSLLNYMADTTEENAVDSELLNIHSSVKKIKRNKQIGVKYMRTQQAMIDLQMEMRREMREMQETMQEEMEQRYQDGISEGEKNGEKRGEQNGEQRITRLMSVLLKEEKYAEMKRAIEDENYRKELYQKYGVS